MRTRRTSTFLAASAFSLIGAIGAVPAPAHASSLGGLVIPSALIISKSSNRNEVHYAVSVDATCAPSGGSPVTPYWRMLERGPDATEGLSSGERRVLGVDRQTVTPSGVDITVRAVPGRVLHIHTWQDEAGACNSSVETSIQGAPARLTGVYAKQRLFGVEYVLLTGVAPSGAAVEERIHM